MPEPGGRTEAPPRPVSPASNGADANGGPPAGPATPAEAAAPAARRRRWPLLAGIVLVALLIGGGLIYRWWVESQRYVSTNNAVVAGRLIQVGSVAAGRVAAVRHDIGDEVGREEVVAGLHVPVTVATGAGPTRQEYRPTSDTLVEVRAPIAGLVVARGANPGDTIPAGHPIMTLVDPRQLWITANIEETQIRRVQLGQRVQVHIDALDLDLEGRVVAITPASAGTFSLLPSQNTTGNYTHVIQLVPVRVALTETPAQLMIGTSATVRIEVAP